MKKIVFIAGVRPNFMKVAPLIRNIDKRNFESVIVHTGQHYDYNLTKVFFEDLDIPRPDYFLGIGSASHAEQTGRMILSLEKVLKKERPDLAVVVGDANSTAAGALAAKKLGIKIAHVEAGLRSFDMSMPEEINRIVTDSIADLFFVTERSAIKNLKNEGKDQKNIFFTGNVMIDSLFYALDKLERLKRRFSTAPLKKRIGKYIYLTLHRPSNVDDKKRFSRLIKILSNASKIYPIIFPVHPRTRKNLKKFRLRMPSSIYTLDSLSYIESLSLWRDAALVLTDSGGLQDETTALLKPCFTLRENTERPVTIERGTNRLIKGEDLNLLPDMARGILRDDKRRGRIPKLWDGRASHRIAKILKNYYKI